MTPEWMAAYDAGIFTEFMEQRAPGHTVLDDKIYRKGHARLQRGHRARAGSSRWTTSMTPRPTTSRRAEGDVDLLPTRSSSSRTAMPTRRASLPRSRRTPRARRSSERSPRCARAFLPTPRGFLGGASGLLVRASGRHHRTKHLGRVQSRAAGSAPLSVLQEGP